MYRLLLTLLGVIAMTLSAGAGLVTPAQMGTGALLLDTNEPGKFVEAPRVATDLDITVTGPIARTRVTQQFKNPTDGWIEGTYVFPLSEKAAVDSLSMVIGDRIVVGEIKERQEAKQIYEEAKAKGQKAALLDQERANVFTSQVANIGPRETVVIQIEYQEPVAQSGGLFSLRIPTVVAPRYVPDPTLTVSENGQFYTVKDSIPDRDRVTPPVLDPRGNAPVNPLTLTVRLNPGFALGEVASSFHDVIAEALPGGGKTITLARAEFADRDFELTWKPAQGAAPEIGLFSEKVDGADYALAYVMPPAASAPEKRVPRDVVFVIDNSGSMGGPSMSQAKASLLYALGRLDPADRFNVIRFDDTMDILFTDTVMANHDNVETAKKFVGRLEASGGTEMIAPLRAALRDARPDDESTLRQVVFITDGAIANEQEMFDVLSAMRGRSRVFMVGIGSAPNSYLMTRAAELGRGSYAMIGEGGQVEDRMRELFAKLENPAVTHLKATFDQASADVTPSLLPDIYQGEPALFLMKMPERKGAVTLSARIAGRDWQVSVPLADAKPGSGIAKLWARRMIDDAEVARTVGAITPEEADRRILALALEHHLVSSVSSLVAVDKTPSRQPGEKLSRADIPLNLPVGWDYDKVFGKEDNPDVLERDAKLDVTLIAMRKSPESRQANAMKTVDLPQTATPAELLMLLGALLSILALVFAFLARRARLA
ncbi:marine proteobacterial sortase target protein [Nordella sp. HKS 07]|uniref:marine proteobacterial sortase target protein n=1 Tax=Nordella sp. HKS 07 TaxID=2712222 RepID=UPI0013E12C34|nr:marine proteobacterial sortase target protein [Nordella sp. HKS 07]QIG50040.1 marine proteobacterial sortase target protein [Nordella sp. HKS 07]